MLKERERKKPGGRKGEREGEGERERETKIPNVIHNRIVEEDGVLWDHPDGRTH